MADTPIEIYLGEGIDEAVRLDFFPYNSDTLAGALSVVESSTRPGWFAGTLSDALAGSFVVVAVTDDDNEDELGSGYIPDLLDTTDLYYVVDDPTILQHAPLTTTSGAPTKIVWTLDRKDRSGSTTSRQVQSKAATESLPIAMDFRPVLETGEALVSAEAVADDPDLSISAVTVVGGAVSMMIGGGVAGTTYAVTVTAATTADATRVGHGLMAVEA